MSGEPRYPREAFDQAGYEEALTGLREALDGPVVGVQTTVVELAELERLVARYPDHARRLVAALPPPAAASP